MAITQWQATPDRTCPSTDSTKKYHVGRAADDSAFQLFSDETIAADDKAFFLKVRDTVKSAVELAKFSQIVQQLKDATQQPIKGQSC